MFGHGGGPVVSVYKIRRWRIDTDHLNSGVPRIGAVRPPRVCVCTRVYALCFKYLYILN